MAAKYSGQNAMNKLMQLVKTALNSKADKSALNGKLDVTGGTIFGDLKVKTNAEGTGNIEVEGEIRAQNGTARLRDVYATGVVHSDAVVEAPSFNLRAPLAEKSVDVTQDGDTAVKMECFDGTLSKGYARLKIGAPTEDDDAVTKKYADVSLSDKMDKSGGTFTGNVYGKYFCGTWLQSTAAANLGKTPGKIVVLDDSGWMYYRTPSELVADLGITNAIKSYVDTAIIAAINSSY